jgi:hypothetical protein
MTIRLCDSDSGSLSVELVSADPVGLSRRGRRVLELVEVIDRFGVDDTIEGALAREPDGAVR